MKNNKKGFTLIELLAVIVILAIIMVIAVPQILNVINNSRNSAWNDNVKMIEKAIETNEAIMGTNMGTSNGTSSVFVTNGCTAGNIYAIAGLEEGGDTDISVTTATSSSCVISVSGDGQFANQPTQTISCTPSTGCTIESAATSGQ